MLSEPVCAKKKKFFFKFIYYYYYFGILRFEVPVSLATVDCLLQNLSDRALIGETLKINQYRVCFVTQQIPAKGSFTACSQGCL